MNLLIDDLQRMAVGPNSLDPAVLTYMQRTIVDQVMRLYRDDYVALSTQHEARGVPQDVRQTERSALLKQLVQLEYRHRASNGQGFSMPQYLEAATNYYRLEVGRLSQSISDYVAAAKHAAELHYEVAHARGVRNVEPVVGQLAHQVAERLDRLETAVEGLSRVSRSDSAVRELKAFLSSAFSDAKKDPFAGPMLDEASTIAAARQYERKHGLTDEPATYLRGP